MIILSHRGLWRSSAEKNTTAAFERSFQNGFGTETDVRDVAGRLVISHDMPTGDELGLDEFLRLARDPTLPLALNIKADGLADRVRSAAQEQGLEDYFVFDMSVPDMRSHLRAGNPVFTRMSEVEQLPVWLDRSAGVWLDAFTTDWYDAPTIESLLQTAGRRVCVVSPDLHGRPHEHVWRMLHMFQSHPALLLCTDLPLDARTFFGESS